MIINISANKLAEFITAKTPARKTSIVRQLVRQDLHGRSFAPYYSRFKRPSRKFLIGGCSDHRIIESAIKKLADIRSTNWNKTDSRITREAFQALSGLAPDIRSLNLNFSLPQKNADNKLVFGNVQVNVPPDLLVLSTRNRIPIFGSLRFYLAKESRYQLGVIGAEYVACMEYLWCVQNSSGGVSPDASLCLVLECIQQRITRAPDDYLTKIETLPKACIQLETLWKLIMSEEAA